MNGNALSALGGLTQLGRRIGQGFAWWSSEIGAVFGEERAAPPRGDLVLHLGLLEQALTVTDRRGPTPRRYTVPTGADGFAGGLADNLAERIAAIRGTGRQAVSVAVLIDPAACFIRTVHLPTAVLPRMREVLARDLEAATPFRTAGVYTDWYVEGEDATGLRVRHVVLKRTRLDPLLAILRGAGLTAGPVSVGADEDRAMPVDLLSGGGRAVPRLLRRLGRADVAALGLAALLAVTAYGLARADQDATLSALETATSGARRAHPARPAPALQALAATLVAERLARPPLAVTWAALAEALPDTAFAEALRLDSDGATVTLRAADPAAALAALAAAPRLGAATPRGTDGDGRLVVHLAPVRPRAEPAPVPALRP